MHIRFEKFGTESFKKQIDGTWVGEWIGQWLWHNWLSGLLNSTLEIWGSDPVHHRQ